MLAARLKNFSAVRAPGSLSWPSVWLEFGSGCDLSVMNEFKPRVGLRWVWSLLEILSFSFCRSPPQKKENVNFSKIEVWHPQKSPQTWVCNCRNWHKANEPELPSQSGKLYPSPTQAPSPSPSPSSLPPRRTPFLTWGQFSDILMKLNLLTLFFKSSVLVDFFGSTYVISHRGKHFKSPAVLETSSSTCLTKLCFVFVEAVFQGHVSLELSYLPTRLKLSCHGLFPILSCQVSVMPPLRRALLAPPGSAYTTPSTRLSHPSPQMHLLGSTWSWYFCPTWISLPFNRNIFIHLHLMKLLTYLGLNLSFSYLFSFCYTCNIFLFLFSLKLNFYGKIQTREHSVMKLHVPMI